MKRYQSILKKFTKSTLISSFLWSTTALLVFALSGVNESVQASSCTAAFTYSDSCKTVYFMDSSTSSGTISAWVWHFGDGTSDSGQTVTHQYSSTGTYTASLYIYDSTGTLCDTTNQTFTLSCSGGGQTCQAEYVTTQDTCTVHFYDSSSSSGTISRYEWYFGDGVSDTGQSVTHTYASSGTYTAALYIYDSTGTFCDSVEHSISVNCNDSGTVCSASYTYAKDSVNPQYVYFNGQVSADHWVWTFGDGDTSHAEDPTHYFSQPDTYQVCLTAYDSAGNVCDSYCRYILIQDPNYCDAYFYYSKDSNLTVNFTEYAYSSDSIVSYSWDFGDGSTSSQPNPTHQYDSAGDYTVCLTITTNDSCSDTYCYPITIQSPCADVFAYTYAMGQVPCTEDVFYIHWENDGNKDAQNVQVSVTLDPEFIPLSSSPSWDSKSGNTLTWNLGTVQASDWGTIYLYDSVRCDTNNSAVACTYTEITTSTVECDTSNNTTHFCDSLGYSYDPNDKRAQAQQFKKGYVTQEEVKPQDNINYVIRFQNTGTAPAVNIEVRDQLSQNLDLSSVNLTGSSHNFDRFEMTSNGELIWKFNNIMLPDSGTDLAGSQGYVSFQVDQKQGNTDGTVINNDAEIVFDMNSPVQTNNVKHTVTVSSTKEVTRSSTSIVLYPNPVRNRATLSINRTKVPNNGYKVKVYNVLGEEVKSLEHQTTNKITFTTRSMTNGMYLYKVYNNKEVLGTGKFLVK